MTKGLSYKFSPRHGRLAKYITVVFLLSSCVTHAENRPQVTEITTSENGKKIVLESYCRSSGGCTLEAQILDTDGNKFRNYLLSNTVGAAGLAPEKISASDCHANLKLLESDARHAEFKSLKLNPKACESDKRTRALIGSK